MSPSDLTPNSALPLQNIGEDGKPPKSRLASAQDAQNLVSLLEESDRERARFNAKIQGMLDGNPPYQYDRLRAAGQLHRSNINFLEGKAALDAALTPYYDIFSSAQRYADVVTKEGADAEQQEKWSRIISEAFHRLLGSYDQFDFNMQTMIHDRTAFGKGFLFWPQNKGWHFDVIRHYRVHVPNGSKASVNKQEVIVIEDSMQCHTLWNYISDKKAAEAAGWNIQATVDALLGAMPDEMGSFTTKPDSYYRVQEFYKDKDIYQGNRLATVQLAHIFVKEFSGKVSHLIVPTEKTPYQEKENIDAEYIFEDLECYDKMSQAINAFFFNTLDGSWNGASGLGRDIFSPMEIKNRLKNSAIDNSFLRSGITLQAVSPESLQNTSLVQFGSINILPAGYNVQQAGILGDVEGLLSMDMSLDNMISSNTGVYKGRLEKPQGNPRTAEEVRLQYQNSATLGNGAVNRFYQELDWFYGELYRRVVEYDYTSDSDEDKAVKAFMDECYAYGIPKSALKNVKQVRAVRNIGAGSIFMRQNAIASTAQFVPMLNEQGRQNWLDDAIAASAGQEAVNRWNPKTDERKPGQDEWDAMIENTTMKEGGPVVITPTQNNLIHAQIHIQAAAQAAASLGQGGEPDEVFTFLEMVGPHIGLHIQAMMGDASRAPDLKILIEQWKKIAGITDMLKKQMGSMIQEKMQAEGQQAQVNLDKISISYKDLPESGKKQVDNALGLQPSQDLSTPQQNLEIRKHQAQLRTVKQGQDMAIKDVETASKLRQENESTQMVP